MTDVNKNTYLTHHTRSPRIIPRGWMQIQCTLICAFQQKNLPVFILNVTLFIFCQRFGYCMFASFFFSTFLNCAALLGKRFGKVTSEPICLKLLFCHRWLLILKENIRKPRNLCFQGRQLSLSFPDNLANSPFWIQEQIPTIRHLLTRN